jgi:hypothetical protein
MSENQRAENGVVINGVAATTEQDDRVVRRLRESRDFYIDRTRKRGHEHGRRWAEEDAEWVQLMWLNHFLPEIPDPYVVHYLTQRKEYETNEEGVQAADAWWDQVVGDGGAKLVWEGDFLDGFIEGALEVWEEVEDKL